MGKKVLLYTDDIAAARLEIAQVGGRLLQQFSPRVFVALIPSQINPELLTSSKTATDQELDAASRLAANAWSTLTAPPNSFSLFESALPFESSRPSASPTEGLSWDAPGYHPPLNFDRHQSNDSSDSTPAAFAPTPADIQALTSIPTSLHMTGSIALGLVLVSRDTGDEVLEESEQTKIVREVQEGLDWLASLEPRAQVSFIYDIRPVTVSAPPGPYQGASDSMEEYEKEWRDAALAELGFPAGREGYRSYVNQLRTSLNTNWAYVTFFSKYQLKHFAYAIFEKVVMSYFNDGWGPDNIAKVFAHESCHIFGAADEYGPCRCGSASGHLGIPNNNCANCFPPDSQVPCLMSANTFEMCEFTRLQLGWDDRLFPTSRH